MISKKVKKSITDYASSEVEAILDLSLRFNGSKGENHSRVLLKFIAKHIEEIKDLYDEGDDHFLIEGLISQTVDQ
jgi:hypothetical protein